MKTVRLSGNVVAEIIPDYALPVEKWYGAEFAQQCVEAPDNVRQGLVYDAETGTFNEPLLEPEPPMTTEEQIKLLTAQLKAAQESSAFLEDCLVEMAEIVYA